MGIPARKVKFLRGLPEPPNALSLAVRQVTRSYRDPLDQIWTTALARVGFALSRSSEVFAASDGRTLTLGASETLDADDCLAQMILHELCHSLVQGASNLRQPDWGLDNESTRDLDRERACLRLQAALLGPLRLRGVFAPTTEHREFYDALGDDPMRGEGADTELARRALERVDLPPWSPHLRAALSASAVIVASTSEFAEGTDLLRLD